MTTTTILPCCQPCAPQFLKMMREAKLIGGKLDAPKVDVIFMRASKAGKRCSFAQFTEACTMVAAEKGSTLDEVRSWLSLQLPGRITAALNARC